MKSLAIKGLAVFLFMAVLASEVDSQATGAASQTGVFGMEQSAGNDFTGTFYDFTRDRNGRILPMDTASFQQVLMDFSRSGWRLSTFSRYYRSPRKLHTTTIMVPPIHSLRVADAFGEPDVQGRCWAVLYKGKLVYREAIRFRFWGVGDDIMLVRVDGKIVLSACRRLGSERSSDFFSPLWASSSPDSGKYDLGNEKATVGDWITLEPGVPLDMEVLLGEVPGDAFCAMLLVEVEGVEYEKNKQGAPVLPIFKTATPSLELRDAICRGLVPGEASVADGPSFRSANVPEPTHAAEKRGMPVPAVVEDPDGLRIWTGDAGQVLEARFLAVTGDQVVLKDSRGKQRKVPLGRLSAEDRSYIERVHLLKLKIEFSENRSKRSYRKRPGMKNGNLPTVFDYVFTVKLKQTSKGECNQELRIEYYAIANKATGDQFLLLDRQESSFVPSTGYIQFSGEQVSICTDDPYGDVGGKEYYGYLVVAIDGQGKFIHHAASHEWLFENVENLRQLPVGAYMDKTCGRTLPSGISPKKTK